MAFPSSPADEQMTVINNIVYIYDLATNTWTRRGQTSASSADFDTLNVVSTVSSTSTTTGALKIAGGVGVEGAIYAGALYTNNLFYEDGSSFTGTQGEIGYTGSQGIPGENGTSGTSGTDGYTGSQGDIGYTGSQGIPGENGTSGTSGTDGYTGSQGDIGYTGSQGDIGYTGSQGESSFAYDSTPPENPQPGDRWFDAVEGAELVWTNDGDSGQWVEISASGFIGYTGSAGNGGGPKISSVVVTDSSYTNLDDTAVALEGGYVKLIGSGFAAGCQVLLGLTPVSSVTYISETEVRAQLPATAAGTYIIYLVNSDGGTAIRVNAVTFSGTPTWVSGSALAGAADTAISIQLTATDATTFALAAGSTLPPGLTLSSGGLLSGTITGITEETVYNFVINAVDAELQDSPRSFAFTVTSGDQYFNLTTLLLPGNANTFIKDASSNNFAVTVAGDTRPNTFNPYLTGWSNYFDGTGDYLRPPINTALDILSGDFTVETWFYLTATPDATYGAPLLSKAAWQLRAFDNAQIQWVFPNIIAVPFGPTIVKGTWYHVAVSRLSGTLTGYVNGVQYSINTAANPSDVGQQLTIGFGGISHVTGYVSNLRVVKGAAVYTADFTPPTEPLTAIAGTSLLTCQSNRFADNSTNNFAVTRAGDVAVRSFSPFVEPATTNGSAYFDGTGDMLTVSSLPGPLTGDFTYECWAYPTITAASYRVLFGIDNYGGLTPFRMYQNGTNFEFWYTGSSNIAATGIIANTWYHIAITRSGGVLKLFVNGVQAGSNVTSALNYPDSNFRIGMDSAGTYAFVGYISNVRAVNGTAVYTANFTPPTEPLEAIAGTSLLTLQNNQPANNSQFLDSSSSNFPITRAGNATQGTFSPYSPAGWSNYFDGSGDYLTLPFSATTVQWWDADYTIEMWVYNTVNAVSTTNSLPLQVTYGTPSSDATFWSFGTNASGNLLFYYYNGGTIYSAVSTDVVPLNSWNHVAMVYTNSNTTLTGYVNGVQVFSVARSGTPQASSGYTLNIGIAQNNGYRGYISNFRIVKGTAVYTADFTPPTQPLTAIAGTSLLTCADNRFIDDSPNNFAITRNGDVRVTNFAPFKAVVQTPATYSAYFDGSGDYLTVPTNTAFDFGTGDFTVEAWVYLNPGVTEGCLLSGSAIASTDLVYYANSLRFGRNNLAWDTIINYTLVPNVWQHIAFIKESGVAKIYVNGSLIGSAANTNDYGTQGGNIIINASRDLSRQFPGYISNHRIVKGTAVYTADFTPPTSPLTAVAGTSLLTCQSPTFVDNSTNNFAITAAGNSQPTTVNPFGSTFTNSTEYSAAEYGGSMYFDGTGDYLTAPSGSGSLGTGNFTVEGWIYCTNSVIAYPTIFSNYSAAGTTAFAIFNSFNNNKITMYVGGSTLAASTNITLNTWIHIAAVRNSGVVTLYINGVSQGTVSYSGSSSGDGIARIGCAGDGPTTTNFTGYISNARWAIGTALYTSNFVPPAAPVEPVANTVLLLNGTGAAITDATTKNVLETVGDAKISTAVAKFGGSSMYFDGSDSLNIPSNPQLNLGSGDFTIEMWAYTTTNSGDFTLFLKSNSYELKTDSSRWVWQINANTNVFVTNGTLTLNTWTHVALVRNGSTTTLYLNGISAASGTSANANDNTSTLQLGTGSSAFVGYINDFRITNGHARYTANFTPPATALQTR